MRKRRRRYRPRRRMYMRRRMYKRRGARRRSKIEVKYFTQKWEDQALMVNTTSTATPHLYANQYFYRDLLASPTIGAGVNQRVGARIFVKSILLKLNMALCPRNEGSTTTEYNTNCGQIRVMFANMVTAVGSNTNDFFAGSWKNPFNALVDRRIFDVHYDKVFSVTSGWAAEYYNSGTVASPVMKARMGEGAFIRKNIVIPVNRTVIIYGDGNSAYTKDDKDAYSLVVMANAPNIDASTTFRVFCGSMELRMYYTDD